MIFFKNSLGFFVSACMNRCVQYSFLLFGIAIGILSCTKEKEGVMDISQNPPRLLSASIQPTGVNLDTDTINVALLSSGNYLITVTVFTRAIDADGAINIRSLSLGIFFPRSSEPDTSLRLLPTISSGDTVNYSETFSFFARRADTGTNTFEFQASDQSNLVSNVLRITFNISRNNSRPKVFNLFAPDTVVRPTSGSRPVFFAISASDSDGLGDISSVFFKSVNSSNPNFEFPLFDDGDIAVDGDTLAGDARFSTIIPITTSANLGTREFRFWARDNTGALSDSLSHFITIVSP